MSDWKGIILAGGAGTRLDPLTKGVTKQLLPVYDKPMIYYPLATLIQCGIKNILIITTAESKDSDGFWSLLGDGSQFGVSIRYDEQPKPQGIAQALLIADADEFISDSYTALILGDNIFHSDVFHEVARDTMQEVSSGKHDGAVFGIKVENPERYGVVFLDSEGHIDRLIEKPTTEMIKLFKQGEYYAVPGLYFYNSKPAVCIANHLKPSPRGELEITDIHKKMIKAQRFYVEPLPPGIAWFDAGTVESLREASEYVRTIQRTSHVLVGCPFEAARQERFINSCDI